MLGANYLPSYHHFTRISEIESLIIVVYSARKDARSSWKRRERRPNLRKRNSSWRSSGSSFRNMRLGIRPSRRIRRKTNLAMFPSPRFPRMKIRARALRTRTATKRTCRLLRLLRRRLGSLSLAQADYPRPPPLLRWTSPILESPS